MKKYHTYIIGIVYLLLSIHLYSSANHELLIEGKISESIQLVKYLDDHGSSPFMAVWYYYSDVEVWKLLLSGPVFDSMLPKHEALAHVMITDALKGIQASSIDENQVMIVRSDYPLFNEIIRIINTGPKGIVSANFDNDEINGVLIKKMIVLRSSK